MNIKCKFLPFITILLTQVLYGSLRHYQYDPDKYTKSRWIKNCWPQRPSPAKRIYELHKLRDHLKHMKNQRRSHEGNLIYHSNGASRSSSHG